MTNGLQRSLFRTGRLPAWLFRADVTLDVAITKPFRRKRKSINFVQLTIQYQTKKHVYCVAKKRYSIPIPLLPGRKSLGVEGTISLMILLV